MSLHQPSLSVVGRYPSLSTFLSPSLRGRSLCAEPVLIATQTLAPKWIVLIFGIK